MQQPSEKGIWVGPKGYTHVRPRGMLGQATRAQNLPFPALPDFCDWGVVSSRSTLDWGQTLTSTSPRPRWEYNLSRNINKCPSPRTVTVYQEQGTPSTTLLRFSRHAFPRHRRVRCHSRERPAEGPAARHQLARGALVPLQPSNAKQVGKLGGVVASRPRLVPAPRGVHAPAPHLEAARRGVVVGLTVARQTNR
jgi:hypothetical protein